MNPSCQCIEDTLFIELIRNNSDRAMEEEQWGFREEWGSVDQIYAVRQIHDKYMDVNREVYLVFMDLEKSYDKIDKRVLWQVMRIYSFGGNLLKVVQSF